MNIFDRNRNELSKYFYDLSKGIILSYVALPIFQRTVNIKMVLVGTLVTVILLTMAMSLKKH